MSVLVKVGFICPLYQSLKKGACGVYFFFRSINMNGKWKRPSLFVSKVQQMDGMIVESNLKSCAPTNKV